MNHFKTYYLGWTKLLIPLYNDTKTHAENQFNQIETRGVTTSQFSNWDVCFTPLWSLYGARNFSFFGLRRSVFFFFPLPPTTHKTTDDY